MRHHHHHHHQFSDVRDDTLGPLETTVCIKLTQDPPGVSGSWMQMTNQKATPYGTEAGSAICFRSCVSHRSLKTDPAMGTVLKLVLFFVQVGKVCSLCTNTPPSRYTYTHLYPYHMYVSLQTSAMSCM